MIAFGMVGSITACQPSASTVADMSISPAGLDQLPLTVRSGSRIHRFSVEVARDAQQQATGLMNRSELAPDRGMIFPYDPPSQVSFWMRNTLIPLDMIFIRADGTIANIKANTVPLSLEPVPSAGPVAAVLEIPGGRAAELGIKVGDRVEWNSGIRLPR